MQNYWTIQERVEIMSKVKKMNNSEKIIQDNDQLIIDKASGISVIFLKAKANNKFRPDLSYHLHFLISDIRDFTMAICLDTGDIISDKLQNEKKTIQIYEMIKTIASQFINNLYRDTDTRLNKQNTTLFKNKSDVYFWDIFNDIKENSFYESMINQFSAIDIPSEPEEIYKNNNISISYKINEYRERNAIAANQ